MKVYKAYTDRDDASGRVAYLIQETGRPAVRLRHLIVHSPSGLNHGYHGSGAADLALAILADHLGDAATIPPHDRYDPDIARQIQGTRAWALHQEFKRDAIAPPAADRGFAISSEDIDRWLATRLPAVEREWCARRAWALMGTRVLLEDGRVADALDVAEGGTHDDGGDGQPGVHVLVRPLAAESTGPGEVLIPLADIARVLGVSPSEDD